MGMGMRSYIPELFGILRRGPSLSTIHIQYAAMPLSDLARELLLDIADYLDNAGLNSLVCTNSNAYNLLIRPCLPPVSIYS